MTNGKKRFFTAAALAAALAACATLSRLASYESGRYEGRGQGYGGTIRVFVETDASSIIDIEIDDHNEDPLIGGEALEALKEAVLEADSTDIDAVSGATETSEGFLDAVSRALEQAKKKQ
jgi:fumarate reductase flavoprotein subunit